MLRQRSFSVPVALLAAGTLFLEILDGTILVTAVPAMALEFGVQAVDVSIVLVAYLVSAAACIPAAGWITDRFGVRRTLLVAISVFVLASALCAVAPGLTTLTAARVLQGAAGAFIVPAGRLAVIRGVSSEDLLDAMAFLTWPALVAPVIAPALGGVLTDTVGWRWIFIINVPLGIFAILVGLVVLPRNSAQPPGKFDTAGFLGAMTVMVSVTGAAELMSSGSTSAVVYALVLLMSGLVVGWFTVRHLRRPGKLFSLSIFSNQAFRVSNVSGGVYRTIVTAVPFLLTLLFQVRFGWSATSAGLAVVALFLGNVAIKPFTTPIIRRWHFRPVLIWSSAAGGLVLLAFTIVSADTSPAILLPLLFLSGALRSIGFSAYNTLQFVDVPEESVSNANILSATLHQAATSLGIAVAVICVQAAALVADVFTEDADVGYQWAFALVALLFLIPLTGAASLDRRAGDNALARPG